MKICFNIDDYGYSKSQVDGTIYSFRNGLVNSTTAMMTVDDELIKYGVEKSKENPDLAIGCHLCITYGTPLTDVKTINTENGKFKKPKDGNYEAYDEEEIYKEYKAQLEKYISVYGHMPTHLDHHHNIQYKTSNIYNAYVRIANDYNLPYRDPENSVIKYKGLEYEDINMDVFKKFITKDSDESIELACHAAFVDEELYTKSSYNIMRLNELKFICSKEAREYVEQMNVELIHY